MNWTASCLSYPNAANTGPAPGTTFTTVTTSSSGPGWAYQSSGGGFVNVTGNNAVLDSLSIPFPVTVNSASGVTISNCIIAPPSGTATGVGLSHTTNATVRNCTIHGADAFAGRLNNGVNSVHGDDTGMLVQGCNIYWCRIGGTITIGALLDNYIHDPGYIAGDHIDGVSCLGTNGGSLLIRHNTILISREQTSPLDIGSTNSIVANLTVDNNLLGGGGFAAYLGNKAATFAYRTDTGCSTTSGSTTVLDPGAVSGDIGASITDTTSGAIPDGTTITAVSAGTGYTISGTGATATTAPGSQTFRIGFTHDIQFINNRISQMYYPAGGLFGVGTEFDHNAAGNTWTNNVFHDDPAATLIPHP